MIGTLWVKKVNEGDGAVSILEDDIAMKHIGGWHDAIVYADSHGDKYCVLKHDFLEKWHQL